MADTAFEWASKKDLVRTNAMHGEQEAKLILEDGFSYDHVQEESVEQKSSMAVEEPCQQLGIIYVI